MVPRDAIAPACRCRRAVHHVLVGPVVLQHVQVDGGEVVHRVAQGVKLIELESEEKLVGLARAERETREKETDEDLLADLEPDDESEAGEE